MAFSNFIPEVWSARLLDHLDKVHVYASLMNRDYEGDIRAFGDTVHINHRSEVRASRRRPLWLRQLAICSSRQSLKER